MPSNVNTLFPSAKEYRDHCSSPYSCVRKGQNCLIWATGVTEHVPLYSSIAILDDKLDVGTSFLRKVDELYDKGLIKYDSSNLTLIESEDSFSEDSTIIFKVFGFRTAKIWSREWECYFDRPGDFHVIRGKKQPDASITWQHKFGWVEYPRELTEADAKELDEDYGNNYVLFAYTPSSR